MPLALLLGILVALFTVQTVVENAPTEVVSTLTLVENALTGVETAPIGVVSMLMGVATAQSIYVNARLQPLNRHRREFGAFAFRQ